MRFAIIMILALASLTASAQIIPDGLGGGPVGIGAKGVSNSAVLLEDGSSNLLLEDGSSNLCLEAGC
jgi:hypothetical protein